MRRIDLPMGVRHFCVLGGFCYFNAQGEVIQINSIAAEYVLLSTGQAHCECLRLLCGVPAATVPIGGLFSMVLIVQALRLSRTCVRLAGCGPSR
jgi:hypothetical protein